ncbi:MAG: succinate dehydrogenase, hydrophobic membrane anchor protein [Anaerolineales bacterium]|nr:succinate dehydrogenase, hydrophobic membrane anchor protein [Anaerolineales bacterium]
MRVFQMQRLTAVALLFFLTLHMIVVHYPPFHIDFEIILERMVNPVWKVIEILFLFTVLIHALAGAYAVLTDYEQVARFKQALAWVAVVAGVAFFIWGALTIWSWQPPV